MEAPERIYIVNDDVNIKREWYKTKQVGFETTEYTRTDAFIKKAEKFFTEMFEVEDYNDNIDIDGSPIFNYGRFIDDFVNYMKGELYDTRR